MKWEAKLLQTVDRAGWLPAHSRILVGVSGGVDSMALLHLLAAGAERRHWTLAIAHLDHGLRGAEAKADARFVKEWGQRLGLRVHLRRIPVAEQADQAGVSIEMAARECRYEWFAALAKRHRYSHLALGHTLDDQAETVLLRLVRGAGLDGLSGMTPVRSHHGLHVVRPLLDIPKQRLAEYLQQRHLPWREDASNCDSAYVRNQIRHDVLPVLRQLNPQIASTLARTAGHLQEDLAIVQERSQADWDHCRGDADSVLNLQAWRELSAGRQRNVIYRWLIQHVDPVGIQSDTVERVLRLCRSTRGTGSVPLPGPYEVVRRYAHVHLKPSEPSPGSLPEHRLHFGTNLVRSWGIRITIQRTRGYAQRREPGIGQWPAEAYLAVAAVDENDLVVRSWQPGDRMRPLGMRGERKLQDIFTDAKLAPELRQRLPLLVSRDRILWLPGFRIAHAAAVESAAAPSFKVRIAVIGKRRTAPGVFH